MTLRRRTASLTDYRSVPRGSGDVAVGAYARRQRRWRLALALVGLVLIAGAGWVFVLTRPKDVFDSKRSHPVAVECTKCHARSTAQVDTAASVFPLECPFCHERACHKLWECAACGRQFLHKGGGAVLSCPHCRSRRVGTAKAPKPLEGADGSAGP